MKQIATLAVLFIAACAIPVRGQEAAPMTAIEFVEINRLGGPSLSPDGKTLAYLRSETDWKNNAIVRRLHLLDIERGETVAGIEPEDEEETHGPAIWSPDGSSFLTLLEREDDEEAQVYLVTPQARTIERLTSFAEEVENVHWAPDGSSFYFLAEDDLAPDTMLLRKRRFLIREYEERRPPTLWRFDLATRTTEPVSTGEFHIRGYSLARDGLSALELRASGGLGDDIHDGELWLTDLATGAARQLTSNNYAERSARLSPDRARFAFIATVNERGEEYYEDNLFVQEVGAKHPRLLFPGEALEVLDFEWDASGEGIYLLGNSGLRNQLYHYDLASRRLRQLTVGDHSIRSWSYDHLGDRHTAIFESASNPGEVHLLARAQGRGQLAIAALTTEYSDWNDRYALPRQEAFRWKSRKGQEIEGLLVYPVGHSKGERFPLVTITHGGPRSSSQFGSWNASRFVAVLTGEGYGVFLPNHRGGTGYGDDFMRDMVGGYFTNAHHDVMSGIDALVERGLADPDRLIKMGWSAGGHMTNKLITVSDRFKAASSGAGASDWLSMYGESDIRHGRTPWFGEAPWVEDAPLDSYRDQSIVQHAWRVSTPTLFHVGGSDVRVPPTQSIIFYRGIKATGTPTELYVAGGEPHNYRKPSHQLFKIQADLSWFATHLGAEPYEPVFPAAALRDQDKEEEDERKEEAEEVEEPMQAETPRSEPETPVEELQ